MDLAVPEYAYMLGFLQTDGSLSWGTRRRGRLSVEVRRADESILHEFRRLTPYPSSITRRERDTNFKAGYQSSVWSVHVLEARLRLIESGMVAGRKSDLVAPPKPPFSEVDYIRGLIDGDGSIGFTAKGYPFISFTTASGFLIDYVTDFVASTVGCLRTVKPNRRDAIYNVCYMSDPAVELARLLYPEGCLALERKVVSAGLVQDWERPAGMRNRARPIRWTPEADRVVLSMPPAEAALILGRSVNSCSIRRWRLSK